MLKRVISGFVAVVIAIAFVFYPSMYPLAFAMTVIAVGGVCELFKGVEKIKIHPVWWLGISAVIVFMASAVMFSRGDEIAEIANQITVNIQGFAHYAVIEDSINIIPFFPLIITMLLLLGFIVEFFRDEKEPIKNIGITLFGAIYVGWLLCHVVMIKAFDKDLSVLGYTLSSGSCIIMLVFLCTWATDTFAFFVGRKFGKKKLSPKSSPNKTVEGAFGGLIGSIVVGLCAGFFIGVPWYHAFVLGFLFGIASQLGDLTESAIKREIGIKDFGNIMPGHGGFLDRIDSMLFTAPLAYYYIIIFLPKFM